MFYYYGNMVFRIPNDSKNLFVQSNHQKQDFEDGRRLEDGGVTGKHSLVNIVGEFCIVNNEVFLLIILEPVLTL